MQQKGQTINKIFISFYTSIFFYNKNNFHCLLRNFNFSLSKQKQKSILLRSKKSKKSKVNLVENNTNERLIYKNDLQI